MIVDHWTEAPWDAPRWPNFAPCEVACRCCGELWWEPVAYDALQAARDRLGAPPTRAL